MTDPKEQRNYQALSYILDSISSYPLVRAIGITASQGPVYSYCTADPVVQTANLYRPDYNIMPQFQSVQTNLIPLIKNIYSLSIRLYQHTDGISKEIALALDQLIDSYIKQLFGFKDGSIATIISVGGGCAEVSYTALLPESGSTVYVFLKSVGARIKAILEYDEEFLPFVRLYLPTKNGVRYCCQPGDVIFPTDYNGYYLTGLASLFNDKGLYNDDVRSARYQPKKIFWKSVTRDGIFRAMQDMPRPLTTFANTEERDASFILVLSDYHRGQIIKEFGVDAIDKEKYGEILFCFSKFMPKEQLYLLNKSDFRLLNYQTPELNVFDNPASMLTQFSFVCTQQLLCSSLENSAHIFLV